MDIIPKICNKCNKPCVPLLVTQAAANINLKSSEWYCKECHLSYSMSKEEYVAIRQMTAAHASHS